MRLRIHELASIACHIGFVSLLSVTGCDRSLARTGVSVRDSAGVSILTASDSDLTTLPVWALGAAPVLDLGSRPDAPGQEFAAVNGAAEDPSGQIAVANDGTKEIRVFDPEGGLVRSVGRRGSGPGEFAHLQLVPSRQAGSYVAFDAIQQRLTRFDSVGRYSGQVELVGLGLGALYPAGVLADSSVIIRTQRELPAPSAKGTVRRAESVVRVGLDGKVLATLGTFPGEETILRLEGSRLFGADPPFPKRLHVAVADSAIFLGVADRYEIMRFTPKGELQRIIRVDGAGERVGRAAIEAYRGDKLARARGEYEIAEWTRATADDAFPKQYPPYDRLLVDVNGALWVRGTPAYGAEAARWVVFESDGRPQATVAMPAGFLPHQIGDASVVGVWRDSVGVEHVQKYLLHR